MKSLIILFLFLVFASVLFECRNEVNYQVFAIKYGERDEVLVASDAVWFYLNLEKELPASICFNPAAYVNAMKRMKTLIPDPNLILPGHDNQVFSKFPKVNERVVRIM